MIESLLIISIVLLSLMLIALVVLLARSARATSTTFLKTELESLHVNIDKLERSMREENTLAREESGRNALQNRQELGGSLAGFAESVRAEMASVASLQKNQLDTFSLQIKSLSDTIVRQLELVREAVDNRLKSLQDENSRKLDQMRSVVDEKLHAALEQRLGESFKLVSERLELVHKGLGEMQSLASGVGDLKRVLTNVKTRGTWGEIQLENLLEQVLAVDLYAKNVATKLGTDRRVEFAIKLPGRSDSSEVVWLPIDAKFPLEDYHRLVDATEKANPQLVIEAGRMLEQRVKLEARSIKEKYLDPPRTTDFAIMFLPTEGLYAEVTRRVGLIETLQRENRVTVMGPNTVAAFLNSLQMGFRTLAIEKRSSEVWSLLAAVKTEFGRFGEILDKTQKKLQEASNTIIDASRKSRAIEQKLKDVQRLPAGETLELFRGDDVPTGDEL
ncbi:MAG: DNA recombination protein RmuC [Ignavibacteriae bacterium]|nr:DNA recombination protein RmuC [Ignavibacteriota bacterium]